MTGELAGRPALVDVALRRVLMLTPIVMIALALLVPSAIRWTCVVAAALIAFNLMGLSYPGVYDNFLILASFGFCGAIIWCAWTWSPVG